MNPLSSWKTSSVGFLRLPWAMARAEDETVTFSPALWGGYPQWAGMRSPHREQSRTLIHGCVIFGPNAQLSTTARPRWGLSQGLPGQMDPLACFKPALQQMTWATARLLGNFYKIARFFLSGSPENPGPSLKGRDVREG